MSALELARLDPGESSVALTRGGLPAVPDAVRPRSRSRKNRSDRDQVRERVINQKLEGLAEGYLEELRSAAIIREP